MYKKNAANAAFELKLLLYNYFGWCAILQETYRTISFSKSL